MKIKKRWIIVWWILLAVGLSLEGKSSPGYGESGIHVPFIANQGQVPRDVKFYARTFGGAVFVTTGGDIVYSFPNGKRGPGGLVFTETFAGGAGREPHVKGEEKNPVTISSYRGNDPLKWKQGISTYAAVDFGTVYQGINVRLKAYGGNVEKLFLVDPGAKPGDIRVKVSGVRCLKINKAGHLEIETSTGTFAFTKPTAYQETGGTKTYAAVEYTVKDNEYGFSVGDYNRGLPLVIDPLLASTSLGGSGRESMWNNMTLDRQGNVYVAGQTPSADFPVTPGVYDRTFNRGSSDFFVAKFDSSLKKLLACTFIGGSGSADGHSVIVDENGNVYVAGHTSSSDFPTTPGAFDKSYNGEWDIFVSKFNSDLTTLLASTYLGGSKGENSSRSLALSAHGRTIFAAGLTVSSDFPTTSGVYDSSLNGGCDIFISALSSDLGTLKASTFLGGSKSDQFVSIDVDGSGNVFVGGTTGSTDFPTTPGAFDGTHHGGEDNAFVSKFDKDLKTLLASTFFGGNRTSNGYSLLTDSKGNVYLAGHADPDMPTTPGAYRRSSKRNNAYIAKFNGDLTTLLAATFVLKGNCSGLALDEKGNIYTTGWVVLSPSIEFPVTPGAFDETPNGGGVDGYVAKFSGDFMKLLAYTFVGGSGKEHGNAIAVNSRGDVYVVGHTTSTNFPGTHGTYNERFNGNSIYVIKFSNDLSAGAGGVNKARESAKK